MGAWDLYNARMSVKGTSSRDAALRREQEFIRTKLPRSLSYKSLVINGDARDVAVINTDNLDTKTICSMPGEDIPHGGLVYWCDNYWLITEKNADNEVYAKGTMRQCNHLLKWINTDGQIITRWCVVEDGTKYLVGEYSDNDIIVTRGDTRISVILPRDNETVRLSRKNRFLIDDGASPVVLAYRLTKPFKLGGNYNNNGVMAFVMTECNTEDSDNMELRIANYYNHFPRDNGNTPASGGDDTDDTGKKVWI